VSRVWRWEYEPPFLDVHHVFYQQRLCPKCFHLKIKLLRQLVSPQVMDKEV